LTRRLRNKQGDRSQRSAAGYFRQGLVVRLASLPWLLLSVVVLGDLAWMPLALGACLAFATCAGALLLADHLLRLRAAGGGVQWLIVFFSAPVLALGLMRL
jgi:apolipoprotein N-acyltransferase